MAWQIVVSIDGIKPTDGVGGFVVKVKKQYGEGMDLTVLSILTAYNPDWHTTVGNAVAESLDMWMQGGKAPDLSEYPLPNMSEEMSDKVRLMFQRYQELEKDPRYKDLLRQAAELLQF